MAEELAQRGRTALVFRSQDGLDELSTTAKATIWQVSNGKVTEHELDSGALGLRPATQQELLGADAKHNASVASKLFAGEEFENSSAIRDVVLLNSAAGIVAYQLATQPDLANESLEERFRKALELASKALASGAASKKLSDWSQATQSI
jgi:anthranilate phosphoribosyltransferase